MRIVLILAVVVFLLVMLRSLLQEWLARRPADRIRRDELVKDPFCQTYVVMSRALKREIDGVPTYFCGPECASRYLREKQGT